MRLAVDVMGGDRAPQAVLDGCCAASKYLDDGDQLLLVGDEAMIQGAIAEVGGMPHCSAVAASQVVAMDESPVDAVRKKRDSSIAVMTKLVAKGEADAALSAGNTGACVAAAQLGMRTLEGVSRAGIAVPLPTMKGPVILCDAGANPEPRPLHLQQYAIMAGVYAEVVVGHAKPRVGLLSIGEEASKGNTITKDARRLLEATQGIDFVGNIEGRDILTGDVHVVVCDGFVGNTILKFAEGFQQMVKSAIKAALAEKGGDGGGGTGEVLGQMFGKLDWQEHGGAPLLGVGGYMTICHGASDARAIANAIRVTKREVSAGINEQIVRRLHKNHAEATDTPSDAA